MPQKGLLCVLKNIMMYGKIESNKIAERRNCYGNF